MPGKFEKPLSTATFGSVKNSNAKTRAFVNGWHDRSHLFVWEERADEIPKKGKPSDELKHELLDPGL